jgi:hypothetical protein
MSNDFSASDARMPKPTSQGECGEAEVIAAMIRSSQAGNQTASASTKPPEALATSA